MMHVDTILKACQIGDLAALKDGLSTTNVQASDTRGCTPLMWAVIGDNPAIVDRLIPYSDLNHQGGLPLPLAATMGYWPSVTSSPLPKEGVPTEPVPAPTFTALEIALMINAWACADLLAVHHGVLPWPEAAKPQDLPRWHARLERACLEKMGHSANVSLRVPPQTERVRPRL